MSKQRVALLAGAVLLVGVVVLSFQAYHYVEDNPRFCTSCHIMEQAYERWATSVHREINCHACHVQSVRESLDQLYKAVTLRPTEVTKHAEVDFTRCGACHLARDPRWKQVADTAGHRTHFEKLGFQCVGCHSRGVHKFVRPSEACRDCHASQVIQPEGMGEFHCTACHSFLAVDHPLKTPGRGSCLACHLSMRVNGEVFAEDAPMLFPCGECHKPHKAPRPTSADCLACHHIRDFGLHRVEAHAECISCHQPHRWRVWSRETCEACHVDRTAHYPSMACFQCHSFRNGEAAPH